MGKGQLHPWTVLGGAASQCTETCKYSCWSFSVLAHVWLRCECSLARPQSGWCEVRRCEKCIAIRFAACRRMIFHADCWQCTVQQQMQWPLACRSHFKMCCVKRHHCKHRHRSHEMVKFASEIFLRARQYAPDATQCAQIYDEKCSMWPHSRQTHTKINSVGSRANDKNVNLRFSVCIISVADCWLPRAYLYRSPSIHVA